MDDQRIVISSALAMTPESIRDREFTSAFRGYQPSEVRQFLRRVAEEMAAAAAREDEAHRSMHDALARAAHPELDEAALTSALGEHTARLIASARETAAGITADAEKAAASMLRDAEARVARMRQDAEDVVARRIEESDGLASNLRQTAQAEVRAIRDQAEAEAEAAVQSARSQGKEMVAEAREVRERMLSDLSRRRRAAQVQLEQLRVARERLVSALEVVRRTLDEAMDELAAAEPEARLAAEEVARDMADSAVLSEDRDRSATGLIDPPRPAPSPFISPIITKVGPSSGAGPLVSPLPTGLSEAGSLGSAARAASSRRDATAWSSPTPSKPQTAGAGRFPPATGTEPEPSARPALRPQSVAESAPATISPGRVDEGAGELATGETPAVGLAGAPVVEELFARIRADSGPVVVEAELVGEAAANTAEGSSGSGREVLVSGMADDGHPTEGGATDAASGDAATSEAATTEAATTEAATTEAATTEDRLAGSGEAGGNSAGEHDATDEAALSHRDQLLDPLDSAIVRALKRVLRDEQNEMLDRLRRLSGQSTAEAIPAADAQREAYRAPVAPLLAEAAKAGGAEVQPEFAQGWADALVDTLIGPLRERLDRMLNSATEEGGEAEAAEGVRVAYRQCRLSEIDSLVRQHTAAAFSQGAFMSLTPGALMRWVVDDDGSCPDCDDNALAGPTAKGDDFPTGQPYPPAHPGCRCLLVPSV